MTIGRLFDHANSNNIYYMFIMHISHPPIRINSMYCVLYTIYIYKIYKNIVI